MKKLLASLILSVILLPSLVLAQGLPTRPSETPSDPNAVIRTLDIVINWLFYVLLIGAVFVVIWAAFTFLTAAGDPEKVAKARNLILYAIVAIVVAFLAKAIVFLVERVVNAGA